MKTKFYKLQKIFNKEKDIQKKIDINVIRYLTYVSI